MTRRKLPDANHKISEHTQADVDRLEVQRLTTRIAELEVRLASLGRSLAEMDERHRAALADWENRLTVVLDQLLKATGRKRNGEST